MSSNPLKIAIFAFLSCSLLCVGTLARSVFYNSLLARKELQVVKVQLDGEQWERGKEEKSTGLNREQYLGFCDDWGGTWVWAMTMTMLVGAKIQVLAWRGT